MSPKKSKDAPSVPTGKVHLPLDGKMWVGADGKKWVDLAVDSGTHSVFWLRRRYEKEQFFLIASCPGGHVLTKKVKAEEAAYIYSLFPVRGPWEPVPVKLGRPKKSTKAAKSTKAKKKSPKRKPANKTKKKAAEA